MTSRILIGDVRQRLSELPSDHYDCVVTSPPYWGLRDYGVAGQIGLEPTLAEHIAVIIAVFEQVRRVLKPSGTCWFNYGDCYATTPNGKSAAQYKADGNDDRTFRDKPFSTVGPIFDPNKESGDRRGITGNKGSEGQSAHTGRIVAGGYLKPKDLCMLPNRIAIALQDAGWWVRSEIIWAKPNAMPDSSGRYRPATSHEKIFLLAKSDKPEFWVARDTGEISASPDMAEKCALITRPEKLGPRWIGLGHFYNAESVRVEQAGSTVVRLAQDIDKQNGSARAYGKTNGNMKAVGRREDKQRGYSRRHEGFNERWDGMSKEEQGANVRLLRNYEPAPLPVWEMATRAFKDAHFATFPPELVERCLKAGCPKGGKVLDPFGGAGTTALVADRMGLDCDIIELNPQYADLAKSRIAGDVGAMFPSRVELVAAE